jgi:adenosylmethionine-8-amino-7-oxononanoate aminotransferase
VHFDTFRKNAALVIARGKGAWLEDMEGRRFLDAIGGMWCTNIGLGSEEMAEAIADQVRELEYSSTFTDMTNAPSARLAAKIAGLAPGDLNRVHLTTGGSTAVDSAFRLIQYYQRSRGKPEKCHIIARENAYHGSTYASMSIGCKAADRSPEFSYIKDTIHHLSAPYFYRAPEGMDEAAFTRFLIAEFEDKIRELGADNVAAFFAEPIMGSGGVIVPPDGYFEQMAAVCREHDILFVADEVVTAWGRIGHWFASEDEFGVVPDIICTAKGLSSGYLPIGAMIYSDRIHEVIAEEGKDRWYNSGFTYSGHPVSSAAALKNIEIMERDNLLEHAREIGTYFEVRLQTLYDLPTVGNIRGRKMMMCVENVANKETRELLPDEVNIGKRISNAAENLGLIVRPIGHLNVMSPALIVDKSEIDYIVENLGRAIEEVSAGLGL